jgi:hypothetical protein
MREIRTSGSMSGDGKRSVAAWPKRPRPSSTLPQQRSVSAQLTAAIGGAADLSRSEANRQNCPRPEVSAVSFYYLVGADEQSRQRAPHACV